MLRLIGGSFSQRVAVDRLGSAAVFTVMLAVATEAHRPALGEKTKTTFPLNPVGSKVLAETPMPDHVPLTPPWLVGRAMAGSLSQMLFGMPEIVGD